VVSEVLRSRIQESYWGSEHRGASARAHKQAELAGTELKAMNGLMQQAKRAARGFRTAANFIAIAYLRLGKLTHLPASPFLPAVPLAAGVTTHHV